MNQRLCLVQFLREERLLLLSKETDIALGEV